MAVYAFKTKPFHHITVIWYEHLHLVDIVHV